jgi:hypothetical protein
LATYVCENVGSELIIGSLDTVTVEEELSVTSSLDTPDDVWDEEATLASSDAIDDGKEGGVTQLESNVTNHNVGRNVA